MQREDHLLRDIQYTIPLQDMAQVSNRSKTLPVPKWKRGGQKQLILCKQSVYLIYNHHLSYPIEPVDNEEETPPDTSGSSYPSVSISSIPIPTHLELQIPN